MTTDKHQSAGAWAKKYHLTARAVIETVLKPYDLGSTQWYVLWHLIHEGPMPQKDLLPRLHVEKATLSGVISALVRKGFVEQLPDTTDQRQKRISLTPAGKTLWQQLPDPIALIQQTAFGDIAEEDLKTVVRVLRTGTERLNQLIMTGIIR
ncbi:MarR family transcriptional regulator [Salmonella enterica subsp. enterica serovar Newport]|uniref:MarR family winged helix-turn-helix transcriptional regulator n=1 Tax=Salmonella enterica TaxID=28901 RepID=UPI000D577C5A|nr:MarR family transcriptional regulator [Salmonella enterica]EIN0285735.1 MarR family transcriptional regulator [Salmonella enterica]EJW9984629.1 MarR family transcriptional regulator [Salmonella enterica]ELG9347165.1 MarR family transcriptional regulator [Salmonella enterica]PVJ97466.1 MarR family transcriptional regulator [Salmonella enterica subsp. enterica serovar Newport]